MKDLMNILGILFVVYSALTLVWFNGKEKLLPQVPYLIWVLIVVTIFVVACLLASTN